VEAELFYPDRQTDIMQLTVAFRNPVNASNKVTNWWQWVVLRICN